MLGRGLMLVPRVTHEDDRGEVAAFATSLRPRVWGIGPREQVRSKSMFANFCGERCPIIEPARFSRQEQLVYRQT